MGRASDAWISLGNARNDWFIVDHGALEHFKASCGRSQYPRTVLFIGHEAKTRALRAVFPFNNHNRRKRDSFINLVCDSVTSESERPILFSELNLARPPGIKASLPDGCKKYKLEWADEAAQSPTTDEIHDTLIARVILPFFDTVCLFADDFRNHEHVTLHITRWAHKTHPSTTRNRPRLVVFSSSPFTLNQLLVRSSLFSHVRMSTQMQSNELSYTAQYLRLRDTILTELDIMQETKSSSHLQFEMQHLKALTDKSLERFSVAAPFDLAEAAKEFNPVDEGFVSHLGELIRVQSLQMEFTEAMAIKLIASAIILHGYPTGTHSKSSSSPSSASVFPTSRQEQATREKADGLDFDPRYLFKTIYRNSCLEAFEHTSTSWQTQSRARCTLLELETSAIFERMEERGMSAADSHEIVVREFGRHCSALKSNRTCLCCLQRKPEHVLSCGHAICDTCVRIFGKRLSSREYHYRISSCIFCGRVSLMLVKQVPPTAFARALTVDGGGVGGAFSLEALKAIERAMKHPYLLQDEFDYAIGTSSGGLIVLLLFLGRRTTNFCIGKFDVLARRIFSQRLEHKRYLWAPITNLLAFCLRDSLYDVERLRDCLRETYGTTKMLFGSRDFPLSGAKVAVTATTVRSSSLCIFSNYNGTGKRREDCGYNHIRPLEAGKEISLCDAAQATSAAPAIFPMKYIDGIDCHVQDGGIGKHNNPISSAVSEVRMIWNTGVDVLLSIGTGYVPDKNALTDSRCRVLDTSIPRCFRSWESARNGQRIWDDFYSHLGDEERESYFRINVPLDRAPDLDAIESMPEIRAAGVRFLQSVDTQNIRRSLLSSAFFFELDELPVARGPFLDCRGSIRCRSPNSRALIEGLISDFPLALFQTHSHETLAFVRDAVRCQECRLYRIGVKFRVGSIDQAVGLHLKFNDQFSHRISGFPNAMSWFAARQGLYSPFGRADHKTSLRECNCPTETACQRKRRTRTCQ